MAGLWLKHFKLWRETSTWLKKITHSNEFTSLLSCASEMLSVTSLFERVTWLLLTRTTSTSDRNYLLGDAENYLRYKMTIILKFYVKLFLKISKILVRVPTNAIVALENQLVKCMIYVSTYLENWVGKFEKLNWCLVCTSNRYLLGIMYQIIFCT